MTLTTLTVDSVDYQSYASLAEANVYLRVEPTLYGGWNGLCPTQRSRSA